MTCTSFIEGCNIKLVQLFSHFWCRETHVKYASLHHKRRELFKNSSLKSDITDQPLLDPIISTRESSLEKTEIPVFEKGEKKKEEEVGEPLEQSPARRISVQDRITLFENKQKEIAIESGEVVTKDLPLIEKHVQRQSKGNEKLNDKLKMKAVELEKLFAQYKLHVHRDHATCLPYRKHVADFVPALAPVPVPATAPSPSPVPSSVPAPSPDSRGKLYDSYMKKREVRLRELWDSNRATMKSTHDRLAKLSWYVERHNSVSITRNRYMKNEQVKDDDDTSEFSDQKSFIEKALPIKKLSTSTRHPIGAKLTTKLASRAAGRYRVRYDNVCTQSVPNFYDLRKENTAPYFQLGKQKRGVTNRQV